MKAAFKLASLLITLFPLVLSSCNKATPGGETSEDKYIYISAINDFHGAIYENGDEMGLAKVGTYLKQQSDKPNTLVMSQGDDWQGSIYSNHNRGRLINDVYAYAKMDARTIGNHDFDWGVNALKDNTKTGFDDYVTPVLAANVYDYNFTTKEAGNIQQEDIGQKSIIQTLENGLKVGIVGVIGEDQITSITSSYTRDICFINHIDVIKQEANDLRKKGCDVVIAAVHSGSSSVLGKGLSSYVDLVLCGHTHRYERDNEDDLYFAQFGSYGHYIGDITLTYNTGKKKVTNTSIEVVDRYSIDEKIKETDPVIDSLIEQYKKECEAEASEELGYGVGYFNSTEAAPNLMAKAIYERAVAEGQGDIILSYVNQARNYIPYGTITYANIYESFPFDNEICIVEVTGSDILYECRNYNNVYFNPSFDKKISRNQKYKIAVIDYLIYHVNKNRYYDYFSSFDDNVIMTLSANYRHILRDWFRNSVNKTHYASDYSSELDCFSRRTLTEI